MFSFFAGKLPSVVTDKYKIQEILTRSVVEVIDRTQLEERLRSGERLRVKLGIDPTSPHLHLGRAVLLLKLRDFQRLGHHIVLIIGDATGVIGDTSDKDSERPMLSRTEVKKNAETYLTQAGKILDTRAVEVRRNAEWLDELTYKEIGEQADRFSVSDFIARDNIKRRLEAGTRVSLREVLYPLMQGYDSVVVQADVEIGGTDQRFNLLAGRTLQSHYGQRPQDVLMSVLIPGTDGRKMSSSWGNTISVIDQASDMYGKVMRIDDSVVGTYFEACTRVPIDEVERVLSENPRDAKMRLAREIVMLYHGSEEATHAEEQFVNTFQKGEVPSGVLEIKARKEAVLADLLLENNVVSSKSELRRLILEGAVSDAKTGRKVTDVSEGASNITLKIGKRRFVRIIIS